MTNWKALQVPVDKTTKEALNADYSIPHDILCCSIHGYQYLDESWNCWKCEEEIFNG